MKKVQINNIELCYQTFGQSKHPAILLLSGLGTALTRWTLPFCQQLVERGYYVIRYDQRDTGCSSFTPHSFAHTGEVMDVLQKGKAEAPFYTLYDLAADAIHLLDYLQIEKAHIMGRSMGGIVGQLLASTYANRVLSLTLIMTTSLNPILPQTSPEVMQQMMAPLPNYFTDKEQHIQARLAFLQRIGSTDLPLNEQEEIQLIEEDFQRNAKPNNTLLHVCAIGFTPYNPEITANISCPTLIVHGTNDPIFPQEHSLDLHAAIFHSKLLLIEHMGHDLHPARFQKVLNAFSQI
ncbi:alpha/beta hydrolase [Myroides sp. NP-2]|uniref:alpha/beta fold hydrolase n=1 Tax=Myroides sp. NP-2 TaxID=2759945 RepID=UPI0015FC0653|nr:alpha/beta hydrolase [Myroides sp. NP-2]MBB1148880.1 alpha/beta hydrolase [Myroides sp. NP-2]